MAAFAAASSLGAQPATNGHQSAQFIASPTAGPAPLIVKFCASAGIAIDFGDGTSSGMGAARRGDCPAGLGAFTTHTYTQPGVYHLRGSPCPSSKLHPACGEAAAQAGTVTITVSGAS